MTSTNKPTLNPNLKHVWQTKARNKVLYGGRSSSKSWDTAGYAAWVGQAACVRFLCVRQFQNKISESVYTLIKSQIDRFGFDGYDIKKNTISHVETGSEFVFYGIARNIDEIKSFEGADVLWIEEAHNLTKQQWEILEPTIRKENSEVWITFNPKFMTDFVYQRFIVNPPPNTIVQKVNYPDNPFLSKTMIEIIENAKEEDYEDYEHIYLGVPLQDDDSVVIKRSWVEACVDAHLLLADKDGQKIDMGGSYCVGFDVADDGKDKNATSTFYGGICTHIDEWKGQSDELVKSSYRAMDAARPSNAKIVYDSIGIGAGVGSNLNQVGYRNHIGFNAGGKVANPSVMYNHVKNQDFFSNIKAQAWWLVADRMRNTYNAIHKGMKFKPEQMISISSKVKYLDRLKSELSTPKRDFDANGKVKVESKQDLAKRDVDSPNLADSFIMGASQNLVVKPQIIRGSITI
ncbi:MAG: PBSX family phage terminase large subunit [Flammeovirgaceae bacterium]|nr:PBSX family phage terminase large subunit [Flammeovirgaceae bacterium]